MVKMFSRNIHEDFTGPNTRILEQTRGVTKIDRSVFFILKFVYLGLRILLRIVLGKRRRDKLYIESGLSFKDFLWKSINFLCLENLILLEFNVPKYDYKFYYRVIGQDFSVMTCHEDQILDRFIPKQSDVVIDVGAHLGRHTIIASKRVGQTGKIVAIEAHLENFKMLNRNIKLNRLTNVIPLNYAVYSNQTKLKLYMPDEESSHHSTMLERVGETRKKFVEVNANTLDNLLQQNGVEEVNWIKIDDEGAEFEVLKGATKILSKSNDIAILIEIHNSQNGTNLYRPIIEFLNNYNFKIEYEKIHDGGERHVMVRKQLKIS
jgi:FkbM family methyltransferase